MLGTDRILYINGLKKPKPLKEEIEKFFYQKLAELIYEQMEKKTGLFSPKTNWREEQCQS